MTQHRIVLIEDTEADGWLFQQCLRSLATNCGIAVLKGGEAALRFVEEERMGAALRPSVIVLNLAFPKDDGLEILAAIRRTPALEHVSTLVVGPNDIPEAQRRINECSVDYTEKPNTRAGYQNLAKRVWESCQSKFDVTA